MESHKSGDLLRNVNAATNSMGESSEKIGPTDSADEEGMSIDNENYLFVLLEPLQGHNQEKGRD